MARGLALNIIYQVKHAKYFDGAQVGPIDFTSVLMIGGSRYCDIIRMLWYACIAVCIARDFDVATEQSQKHAKVIFTNEDTKHLKAAEKMKSLSCSGHAKQVHMKGKKCILKILQV